MGGWVSMVLMGIDGYGWAWMGIDGYGWVSMGSDGIFFWQVDVR